MVERGYGIAEVVGSNPIISTTQEKAPFGEFFLVSILENATHSWESKAGARRREAGLSDFLARKYG